MRYGAWLACGVICAGMLGWTASHSTGGKSRPNPVVAVSHTLDELHDAASKADGERYFALFAPDAVFLGTDATERWSIDEFKAYAMPRFDTGKGWTYQLIDGTRFISISNDGSIAWFDELLENAKYGTCRGSGVLRRIGDGWKIAQYNLAFTIPNERAQDVVAAARGQPSPATTLYIVRHAEKAADRGDDDPDLSEAGVKRAYALLRMLRHVKFDHIFASQWRRTQATVQPFVSRSDRPTVLDSKALAALPERVRGDLRGQTIMICGHSNTIPQLLQSLGVREPVHIPDDQYDNLFVVTIVGDVVSCQRMRLDG